ncbi:MAG TPA: ABC transporter substrate-binding protein [Firmicutes bacterium]|nr:ABC transporter substrate-binding protein [Bacillota bacterium]
MKRAIFMLLVMLALVGLAFGGASLAAEPIKIGALYNLTGAFASIDAPALNGARIAVEEINASGGLLGCKIELVAIDTKSEQQASATAARQLVSQKVVSAIGYGDTTFVLAAAPLFQQAGIPFVTSGATLPDLPQMIGNCMFMAPFGDDAQAYAVAAYAHDTLGARRAWVLTDNACDFTLALSKFFKERFTKLAGPKAIVLEDFYQTGDKDYSSQIARLKTITPPPDILFVSAIPGDAGVIIKQIREAGISTPILSGDGFDTPLIVEVPGKKLADEVYFATHTSFDNPSSAVQHFAKAYKGRYGRAPENAFAALGYDAIMLIARAIKRAGSAEPAKIREALGKESGYNGATGTIRYKPGERKPDKSVTIIKVERGELKFATEVAAEKL